MKKFLAGIAAAAIITVPMTSFALESMSKGSLKKATGQAGVSIALDDIVIVQKSNPTTIFWDNDGVSSLGGTVGNVTQAGIKISYTDASEKMIIIDGILDDTKYGETVLNDKFKISDQAAIYNINSAGIVKGDKVADASTGKALNVDSSITVGTATVNAKNYGVGIAPLTIDVGTCQSLTAGLHWNATGNTQNVGTTTTPQAAAAHLDVAGVVIGLPTVEITTYHSKDTKIISLATGAGASTAVAANSGTTVPNVSNEFIRIEKNGTSQMAILGGRLEIAPH